MTDSNQKRVCCRLMRELQQTPESLKDPRLTAQTLDLIAQHCVLMKLMGKSVVKWDLSKSECYIAFYPEESQAVMDEISITFSAYASLGDFSALLSHITGILAHNAKLQQLSEKMPFLVDEVRKGEKKYGSVPETSFLKENPTQNALSAGDLLKAHPLLEKSSQFDGVPPHNNPNPVQNPEAAENAERLQNQLKPEPKLQNQKQNQYTSAPTLKPGGG